MKFFQTIKTALRRFVSDKHGHVVMWQTPNPPLIAWFILAIASHIFATGKLHSTLKLTSSAFLFTWAYLEITQGASYFRRAIGLFFFIGTILSF